MTLAFVLLLMVAHVMVPVGALSLLDWLRCTKLPISCNGLAACPAAAVPRACVSRTKS